MESHLNRDIDDVKQEISLLIGNKKLTDIEQGALSQLDRLLYAYYRLLYQDQRD